MPHMAPMHWLMAPLLISIFLYLTMNKSYFEHKPILSKTSIKLFTPKWNW